MLKQFLRALYLILYSEGVLGNKCAGQHNLKSVQIREIVREIKYTENAVLHIKAFESQPIK